MRSAFSRDNFSVYILAGGKSSRFGEDKARFCWEGKRLIDHVADTFSSCASVKVVLKKGADDIGLESIHDKIGEGPLSGIHAALQDASTEWVFVIPCDTLGFSINWIDAFEGFTEKAIAFHDERWFPLFSAFHKDALVEIIQNLEKGRFAIWQSLDALQAAKVKTPEGWESLHRIDSKEDLDIQ